MNQTATLRHNFEIAPEEEGFFSFIAEHFDSLYYLGSYSDVAQAGIDPLEHWLNYGLREGRQISRSVDVRHGKIARRSSDRNWKRYCWRGEDIAVRQIKPIPPEIMAQICNQARHDAAVLAAGANSIVNRGDREGLGHIDVAGLQRAIPHGMEFLLVVPDLSGVGDQGFAADLIAALSDAGFCSIQTIVADQESPQGFTESDIPEPFRTTKVLFWQDFLIVSPAVLRLAMLIRVLRPRVTIVASSRVGHEMVARFGRALSECTKMYCIFTDVAQNAEFGASFPRETLPFATALTEDSVLAARLREQYSDVLGYSVAVLPQKRHSPAAFLDAVAALFART
jgi:hypothetical protein